MKVEKVHRTKKSKWKSTKIVRIIAEKHKNKAIEIAMETGGSFMFKDNIAYLTQKQLSAMIKARIKMMVSTD